MKYVALGIFSLSDICFIIVLLEPSLPDLRNMAVMRTAARRPLGTSKPLADIISSYLSSMPR